MITQFGKASINAIQAEAAQLLQKLAEKHGVTIRAAGGNFDVDKATLKFEFRLTSEEAEKAAFEEHCAMFNCKPSDYGRVATINGRELKLIGFELSRRAFPIRVRSVADGKVVLLKEDVLRVRFHTGDVVAPIATAVMMTEAPKVNLG